MERSNVRALVLSASAVVAALTSGTHAANINWLGGTSGDETNFSNGLNWDGGVAPADSSLATGDIAVLPSTVTTYQPTLTAARGLKGLLIQGSGWTLGGTGLTLTVRGSGPVAGSAVVTTNVTGTNTIDSNVTIVSNDQPNEGFVVATGGTLVLNGAIARSGSGGGIVVKSGGGTLDLYGGTAGSGVMGLRVAEGTVRAMGGAGIVDNVNNNQPLSLTGTGTFDVIGIPTLRVKELGIGATATLTSSSVTTRTVYARTASSQDLLGLISGNLNMQYGTNGSTSNYNVGNASNTYTGFTRIDTNATLVVSTLADGGAPSSIGQSTNDATNLRFGGGILRYTGPAFTLNRNYSLVVDNNSGGFDASGTGALVIAGNLTNSGNNFQTQRFRLRGTNTGANTVSGLIQNGLSSRTTALDKFDAGTWILTNANTYTGTTVVGSNTNAGGMLLINNSTGSGTGTGAVSVLQGTLGGTGAMSGLVTIGNSTGTDDSLLSPGTLGTEIESLGTGALTFNSDGVYVAQINSGLLISDLVAATGAIALGDGLATLQLSDLGAAVLPNGTNFTLMTSTVAVTGYFDGLAPVLGVGPEIVVGSNTFQLNYNPTDVTLTVVPEPTAIALFGLTLMPLLRRRSR